MESVLDEVELPVIVHEILAEAISLYALDDGSPAWLTGILISNQLNIAVLQSCWYLK